jgi:hypothetical protein
MTDLTQEAINFEDITTQSCNTNDDVIYKLREGSLTCEIQKFFTNEPSSTGTPTILDINSNRVVYRFYNGTVSADNICETIPLQHLV